MCSWKRSVLLVNLVLGVPAFGAAEPLPFPSLIPCTARNFRNLPFACAEPSTILRTATEPTDSLLESV